MRSDEIYLGQKVRTSQSKCDYDVYMVKRIDSDEEIAYVVNILDGSSFWVSFVSLFRTLGN